MLSMMLLCLCDSACDSGDRKITVGCQSVVKISKPVGFPYAVKVLSERGCGSVHGEPTGFGNCTLALAISQKTMETRRLSINLCALQQHKFVSNSEPLGERPKPVWFRSDSLTIALICAL